MVMIRILDVAGAIFYILGGLSMSLGSKCWLSVDRRRGIVKDDPASHFTQKPYRNE